MRRPDEDSFDPETRDSDASANQADGDTGSSRSGSRSRGSGQGSADDGDDPRATAGDDLARQLTESQDKYLRLAAEYDNFRRRSVKERAEAQSRGQAELVRLLLDPLDDLARFAHFDPAKVDPASVITGAEMVEKKFQKVLATMGLEVVNPIDQTFDPTKHEAVTTVAALSPEDDHVIGQVYQPGYIFNGQLLRPARVVVKQWNG